MKTMSKIQKIKQLGQSRGQKQEEISIQEVYSLWDMLVARYEVIETTNVLENFTRDDDLKWILSNGLNFLQKQTEQLEKLLDQYGIPMPYKPPENATSTLNVEIITDKFIYKHVLLGIQRFLPKHLAAFIKSTSPTTRQMFKEYLTKEIDLYDKLVMYGNTKGYLDLPPVYRS